MDAIESANRHRAALPSISYLDAEKVRREETEYQNRNTGAPTSIQTRTATSPKYEYPPGPPPPYSHPAPTTHASTLSALQAVHTPPESRRTSGDEKENIKQTARQSLPSIHEALGVDQATSYPAPTSAPAPPAPQSHLQPAPASPSPTTHRSYGMEPPPGPRPAYEHSSTYQPYSQYRPEEPPRQSYAPVEAPRNSYAPAQETRPALYPLQTSHHSPAPLPPKQPASYAYPPSNPSPTCEYPPSQPSSGPMAPPSSIPYGYAPYPPRYVHPTPPASVTGPVYQPSTTFSAPAPSTPSWKSEVGSSARFTELDRSERTTASASYGDSVKRHLDLFDLEAALNEISQTSGMMLDFSRQYGNHLHQTARSGPTMHSLPKVAEVDDLIAKSHLAMDSLAKIREVILTQQAAYDQQAQETRYKAEQDTRVDEHQQSLVDDSKAGGFAGAESKKRRGRAAPPGRCHSCNRAETPEWRRGPDGARTLCNACGLHYAKLTRKAGGNKAAVGSSNLLPKGPDSNTTS